ncbi:DNA polymerase III, delta subunit [Bartonella bacilliformis str. Heidi Mejia]|uniref:DNA polymerase III subunit delta n=1 Tax=Bartonella bacilliformis TaxID=774 RepID=UPI00044E6796|nr:DNA polymerase III subunit delta [Bartonella bacilliformis]EYS90777.1 DNA polymerase III, delta subunit [Bartonella bacilliformis str. Heidi Mejia]EYS95518.1 DNA polymerase III, delta subunit [Bartonella bacilliformis Peru-18]KEG18008.1 DNA polymerase III, delta subunit [Bartonella bacilliformis Cond044]KEG18405.1 DNA polymerase III, delta subunit [Bartonella bacilliformis CUSCO5]KEG20622.1 DNA polymerase III, delta subunit [Bartonella bacilliformis Hosp800-02]
MAQKKAHEVDHFLTHFSRSFPIVLIYGPDRGLVCERVQRFIKLTQIATDDPFATVRLDAAEIDKDPARLGDEARTLSLFGSDRLVWVSNGANQKNFLEALKLLIAEPPEKSFILIEAGDLKKGIGLRNIVETASVAMALPCYADDVRSLDTLIDEVLESFKMTLSLEARKGLYESLGGDHLVSRRELEKLCLYASEKRHITLEDVKAVVSDVSAFSPDEVIDAILLGDGKEFEVHFSRYVAMHNTPFLVLSTAQRHFQQLQILRYQVEIEQKTAFAVISQARPPIFFQRKKTVEKALKYWTLEKISYAMEKIQCALLESRKNPLLGEAIIHRVLLELVFMIRRQMSS